MIAPIKRREFITLLGGAAAWPVAARAQQAALPAIGFLDARAPDAMGDRLRGFRQGLAEIGYVEGDNVTIVYRWGENKIDRLPELAAELVRRPTAVLVPSGNSAAVFGAKAATATIPIVFLIAVRASSQAFASAASRTARSPAPPGPRQADWRLRANVWRKVTSPAQVAKQLRSVRPYSRMQGRAELPGHFPLTEMPALLRGIEGQNPLRYMDGPSSSWRPLTYERIMTPGA
jgi:hypothetical protein